MDFFLRSAAEGQLSISGVYQLGFHIRGVLFRVPYQGCII